MRARSCARRGRPAAAPAQPVAVRDRHARRPALAAVAGVSTAMVAFAAPQFDVVSVGDTDAMALSRSEARRTLEERRLAASEARQRQRLGKLRAIRVPMVPGVRVLPAPDAIKTYAAAD